MTTPNAPLLWAGGPRAMRDAIGALIRRVHDRFAAVEDGCCGCGRACAAVLTLADDQHPCTEGWCWPCYDQSPALWTAPRRVLLPRFAGTAETDDGGRDATR